MPIRIRGKDLTLLKKGTVQQNWSQITLYNLSRLKRQNTLQRTFYQQKFAAKQETRKYHGQHLTKRQWQNIFKHSLKSVVPMDSRSLATSDGSEFGAGRGSGLEAEIIPLSETQGDRTRRRTRPQVPYMMQTFAPMERRLDMAIFRAMFASSALQARQFVIHGFVQVNGKKMQFPQYMLNPGDMFSVDIEKVLFATGAPKILPPALNPKYQNRKKDKGEGEAGLSESASVPTTITSDSKSKSESEPPKSAASAEGSAEDEQEKNQEYNKTKENQSGEFEWWKDKNRIKTYDETKPYRTPWRPRYYLSAFAFIPKYLEVNHNTGHAVYLRHPVARPGQSEVPTPFHPETMQLAFNWFLRRR